MVSAQKIHFLVSIRSFFGKYWPLSHKGISFRETLSEDSPKFKTLSTVLEIVLPPADLIYSSFRVKIENPRNKQKDWRMVLDQLLKSHSKLFQWIVTVNLPNNILGLSLSSFKKGSVEFYFPKLEFSYISYD